MMAKYINQKTKFALIPCQRHPPKESLGPLGKGFSEGVLSQRSQGLLWRMPCGMGLWSYLNPRF